MNSSNAHDPKGSKVSEKGSRSNGNQWNGSKSQKGNGRAKDNGRKGKGTSNRNRQQPKKDSNAKRVNYDNAREDRVASRIMEDAKSGKFNDINDFLKNPTLVQAAGSIPVAPILGRNAGNLLPVPGIMAFYWKPNFGNFADAPAKKYDVGGVEHMFTPAPFALNQAADTTYSYLVHANSRNYAYNSSDLFILIMAGSQVFAAIEAMKRAYGLLKRYVETSAYMPDSELKAMGFDPEDMRKQFSHMWFDINLLISQSRQVWIPTTFPFITRWMDMNSNFYKDAEGPYAQEYIFVQQEYYQYNEIASSTGGSLSVALYESIDAQGDPTSIPFRCGWQSDSAGYITHTWSQWVSLVQGMITRLMNSEDRGIIYGDLLNAFGADRILAIPEIAADYAIEAEYSPEISMQIENMTVWRAKLWDGWLQVENRIVPYVTGGDGGANYSSYTRDNWSLNFHTTSNPTPEMFLLATRFMTMGARQVAIPKLNKTTGEVTAEAKWLPITAGSEIITETTIVQYPLTGPFTEGDAVRFRTSGTSATIYETALTAMSFDWHPFVAIVNSDINVSAPTAANARDGLHLAGNTTSRTYGDYDRYAAIRWEEVSRINDVAFMSLYDVPSSIA